MISSSPEPTSAEGAAIEAAFARWAESGAPPLRANPLVVVHRMVCDGSRRPEDRLAAVRAYVESELGGQP